MREKRVYEDWEIMDRRIVGRWADGLLIWWCVLEDEYPRGIWRPFVVAEDGMTIRQWPEWAPLPGSQYQFLTSPVFETFYSGSRGTGKSEVLLMDFARDVGKGYGANWRGILFRKQLGDLDEMVRKTTTLYEPIFPGFHFKLSKADYAACWPSGEQLLFRHMLDETEYEEYHGHQYPWIGWEELTQWDNLKAYKLMFSCCRPTAPNIPTRIRCNSNPSGTGHNAVKKRFQLPGMFGRIIRQPEEEPRVALQSFTRENFVLLHSTPNYIARVKSSALSAAQADAWANGNWDVTEGGMVDDIWDAKIHVIDNLSSQQIPMGWHFSRSYDHGQSKPFSVLWWAESNGEPIKLSNGRWVGQIPGDLILFMEWYGTNGEEDTGLNMLATKIAQGILDRERDAGISARVVGGVADTEIWSKDSRGTGRAPIDDFNEKGVYFDQADKSSGSRKRGWTLLRERVGGSLPGLDGTREKPGIFVCMRARHWLELVPTMPRSMEDPDEIPKTYEDHCADSTRYRFTWTFMGLTRRSF
jgi:hypothetical protein